MATALVITTEAEYGSICYPAFRARNFFPVVVATLEQALSVLRQFKVEVLVVHASRQPFVNAAGRPDDGAWYDRLRTSAPGTPIVVVSELPPPESLASGLRQAVERTATTPAGPTAGGSRASSSSREGSSV